MSLEDALVHNRTSVVVWFQSPSLRGSGRFWTRRWSSSSSLVCFNPLHCGAVVASLPVGVCIETITLVSIPFIAGQWSLPGSLWPGDPGSRVSIPFIAGQWSLRAVGPAPKGAGRDVSIPFIAGQWSLPPVRRRRERCWASSFNPLHCGAVVASDPAMHGVAVRVHGFNPLHCGAVVASARSPQGGGQQGGSFNPLHCGAVVASMSLQL